MDVFFPFLQNRRAQLNSAEWPSPRDASRPGPPCLQNPVGDPRPAGDDAPPPDEDCLQLNVFRPADAEDAPARSRGVSRNRDARI